MTEESSPSPLEQDLVLEPTHLLSTTQLQDIINQSVQAALTLAAASGPSQSTHPPVTVPLGTEPTTKKGKSSYKRKNVVTVYDSPAGEVNNMRRADPSTDCHPTHPTDPFQPLSLRESTKRHGLAKRAKPDSYVLESDDDSSAESDKSDVSGSDYYEEEDAGASAILPDANPDEQGKDVLDAMGEPLFNPDTISHPRSGDWSPLPHVSQYVELWARKTLDKSNRNKLRAECPRPHIPMKAVVTPTVDPILMKYLLKTGKMPKKGIDRSFTSIQDRILDLFGPLTKILNLAEQSATTGQGVDLTQLRGWAQRAICLTGNANTACSVERRRSILMRLDPQLAHLAESEPGPSAGGMLFGESLIKDINKFVGMFNSLDKAQTSLKKPNNARVFPRAGRYRGRSAGRYNSGRPFQRSSAQPHYTQAPTHYTTTAQPAPFFPPRGRPWRGRGQRGYPRSRPYSDSWVLNTVTGFQIDLVSPPTLGVSPPPIHFSEENVTLIDSELRELIAKHAVTEVTTPSPGFFSNLFLVKKKGGGYRPVINLRDLNQHVAYRHFKMEGIHCLRDLLTPGDWLVKVDLKDAYLTVPMHPDSQHLLRFRWWGRIWQFTCLPFGLSSAPWCFTKLLKPVVAALRSRGVRLIIYLDDLLILTHSKNMAYRHMNWTIDLLQTLGFIINREKSVLVPAQEMEFLGFSIDTHLAILRLPSAKLALIRKEIRAVLRKGFLSLRILARIVGLLAASIQAIFPAPLHYRALQRLKILHLRQGLRYADEVSLSPEARAELRWWLRHATDWNGRTIFNARPDVVIESDASRRGWGARLGMRSTGGIWSREESLLHINALELSAALFAIQSFLATRTNCCVLLRMDNIAAVQYINRLGGTRSKILADISAEIWHFCLSRDISLVAEYIPGVSNTIADWNSRYLVDSSDWGLDRSVFTRIELLWGPLGIDLFASRLNHQLPHFFSWRPDPGSSAVDAFRHSWTGGTHYAFPPFSMIPRVLLQITNQGATVVLITPWWPAQPWFPLLLDSIIDHPRLLPRFPRACLTQPRAFIPWWRKAL
ncbi:uncharacterized protein LOC120943996 [Rana temporaria]|uniref:uncharacterized protein LOC120943996 n=1 Tax=Rana temporaria TaxID=8407 RepID=UPI001AACE603|nr:uncharacterized protein LOC120943996 [Rana temporaria]